MITINKDWFLLFLFAYVFIAFISGTIVNIVKNDDEKKYSWIDGVENLICLVILILILIYG